MDEYIVTKSDEIQKKFTRVRALTREFYMSDFSYTDKRQAII